MSNYDPRKQGALCDKCVLRNKKPVPPEDHLTLLERLSGTAIAVVGEAPGDHEERQGIPFCGPSGHILDKALKRANLSRRALTVINTIACRPDDNKLDVLLKKLAATNKKRFEEAAEQGIIPPDPIPSPIECCRPRLESDIRGITNFITLGKTATTAIAGARSSILDIRGGLMQLEATERTPARRVMPTVHPAFVLRSPRWTHVFNNDIFKAARWFRDETDWTPPQVIRNPTPAELQEMLSSMTAQHKILSADLETDGVESLTAKIRCVGIGVPGKVIVVSILSKDGHTRFYSAAEEKEIIEVFRWYFETYSVIGQNFINYDAPVLKHQWGIICKRPVDTLLLHKSVESELPHRLSYIGSVYTDAPAWKCYDAETEILTQRGWIRFPELEPTDQVAQWHAEGSASFVTPDSVVSYEHDGDMWRLSDQAVDLLVTPGHKMIYMPVNYTELKTVVVESLPRTGRIPHVGTCKDGRPEDADFVRLVVALQADGSWAWRNVGMDKETEAPSYVDFGFTKKRKIQRIEGILTRLGVGYKKSLTGTINPRTRIWVDPHPIIGRLWKLLGKDKVFGPWLLEWDLPTRQLFLSELTLWDGTRDGVARYNYDTTCSENASWVQACAVLSGVAARYYVYPNKLAGAKDTNRVRLLYSKTRSRDWSDLETLAREKVAYCGKVYCVSVPSGFLLVRRGGKVTVSGNSDREGNKLSTHSENDEELAQYCAVDVDVTAIACPQLVEQVNLRNQMPIYNLDTKVQVVCTEMHEVGMYVDQERRLKKEKHMLGLRYKVLGELRDRLSMSKFNPGSTQQVRELLFNRWHIDPPVDDELKYTASDEHSTADVILRAILTDSNVKGDRRDVIKLIRRYRKLQKLLGTYVIKLRPRGMSTEDADELGLLGWDDEDDWVDKETRKRYGLIKEGIVDPRTGRMHPGWSVAIPVTGRLSSFKPMNAQNFPPSLRDMVAPAPGHVFVGADMDQVEMRVGASLWGVELYLRAFSEGKDPHSMTAFAVFGEAFCAAAGIDPAAFDRGGKLIGKSYDEHGHFKDKSGDAYDQRRLSKNVQFACLEKSTQVITLGPEGSKPISEMQIGDQVWCWSKQRSRYEPANVTEVMQRGVKRCVKVKFSWWAGAKAGRRYGEVIATEDHLFLRRDGTFKQAADLVSNDRLMPFRRRQSGEYRYIFPFNDNRREVGEHRVVAGFYSPGQSQTHVHHVDEAERNNSSGNLDPVHALTHYHIHRDNLTKARLLSRVWWNSIKNMPPTVRRAAAQKTWEKRRANKSKDKTYGLQPSVLDPWSDKIGVLLDAEIARQANCTAQAVAYYRKVREIPPPVGQRGWLVWLLMESPAAAEWQALMRTKNNEEIAVLVNTKYGTDLSRSSVGPIRNKLGLANTAEKRVKGEFSSSALDPFNDHIGKYPDSAIARYAGVDVSTVTLYRKKHGIPSFSSTGGGKWENHIVESVEYIGEHEVWDIEVDHEDHNFALASGVFVHNSQYMGSVETVHQLVTKLEVPAIDPITKKPLDDGTTDLPYALMPQRKIREMRENWLRRAPEYEHGWAREIQAWRNQGHLREPVLGRRRDFLDGENANELVNFRIQSSVASLMNMAILNIREAIPMFKWGPGTGIFAQVHDWIGIECPADGVTFDENGNPVGPPDAIPFQVANIMSECMNQTHPALTGVRFTATPGIGRNWKDV